MVWQGYSCCHHQTKEMPILWHGIIKLISRTIRRLLLFFIICRYQNEMVLPLSSTISVSHLLLRVVPQSCRGMLYEASRITFLNSQLLLLFISPIIKLIKMTAAEIASAVFLITYEKKKKKRKF